MARGCIVGWVPGVLVKPGVRDRRVWLGLSSLPFGRRVMELSFFHFCGGACLAAFLL